VDLRGQLERTLGGTHTIERELGGGGMSCVFVATEIATGQRVVFKLLAPELATSVSGERFRREMQVAAQLKHPHIVPLSGTGSTDTGLAYFSMPFMDGETLRARLQRGGEMPLAEVRTVLRGLSSALAYAHERGIVHRDIKPENIVFAGDVPMIMDFGVAKALSDSTVERTSMPRTTAGTAVGTPAYMSPEQAAGDPGTDHRADLYALGIVAYEMLSGHAPFEGRPFHKMLAAHVAEIPEDVARKRPGTPPELAALVMRCLAKNPADRPQSARAVLAVVDPTATPSEPVVIRGRGRVSRPVLWLVACTVIVMMLALAAYEAMRRS
jgi:eukaryotic-like serine/threonine-protein kinase